MTERETELQALLAAIRPADRAAMDRAKARQAMLAKPPGSLGKLEDISVRLAGITGRVKNELGKKRIIVLCADNGVVEEGISATPRSVTAAQAVNMTHHLTGMSAMAHHFGNEVVVVDMGIAAPYDEPAVLNRRIAPGTRNLLREPAMTREQALQAILTGAELARRDGHRQHDDLFSRPGGPDGPLRRGRDGPGRRSDRRCVSQKEAGHHGGP